MEVLVQLILRVPEVPLRSVISDGDPGGNKSGRGDGGSWIISPVN